jgi:predicted Zn finger-like uncharacterized protein
MQLDSADIREQSREDEDHGRSAKDGSAMKIQCQSCQAKYTIADDKVLGKVVKIRCKKCSATIVINGNEQRPAEDNADTHVFDYASQGASDEPWTVNVADGDQRTMSAQEIVAEYKAGTLNDETYCWKDGMADWLPLREIDQLYGAINLGPRPSLADDNSIPPQASPAAAAGALFPSADEAGTTDSPFSGAAHANGNGNGSGHGALFGGAAEAAQAAPAAARRGGGRGQGADLFGNVASAGGEEDVMTSAAGGGGAGGGLAPATDDKLTGQRNENSVLFSLSALTDGAKAAPEANRTTATSDGSGLIDIRALSANMAGDDRKDKGSRVDDIMNLSGGGAFGAALAAPILAPPPLEAVDMGSLGTGQQSGSNKTMLFAILGGAGILAIGGIVMAVLLTRSPEPTAKDDSTTSPTTAAADDTSGALAMNDTTSDDTSAAPQDDTPAPPGTGNATGTVAPSTGPAVKRTGGSAPAAKETKHAQAEAPPPPAAKKPTDFGSALAEAAGKPKNEAPKSTGGGSTAPFDRGAAAAALGGVNVQACKKPGGPTGGGHVKVTFAPNGSVSSAVVDGGPYPGTPVGGCIAGKYRGARVPAFSGGPVSVGKSFTVN